jgi:hypothetical protein
MINPRHITEAEIRALTPKAIQLVPIERPSDPEEGLLYADSSDHQLYFYDGSTWQELTFSLGPSK